VNTGGAVSRSKNGALFLVSRGLNPAVVQLEPTRKVLANSYNGEPLDCVGGVLNDLSADSRGGVDVDERESPIAIQHHEGTIDALERFGQCPSDVLGVITLR